MTHNLVDTHCAALPGSYSDRPFGPETRVWKVAGRMFAAYTDGGKGVSVRCADPVAAQRLVQMRKAESAPYLKRGGWVLLPWTTDPDELLEQLTASYHAVRNGLPPADRLRLPPLEGDRVH